MKAILDFAIGMNSSTNDPDVKKAYKQYLRIEFTKAAMQGILSSRVEHSVGRLNNDKEVTDISFVAVKLADALIKELGI